MLFSLSKPGVPWRTGLRSAAVVSLLAMGATACGAGGSSDNPQAGQAPQSTQATSTPDGKKTLDAPVAKGLGSLTSGNLTLLAFYDPSTGKETFSTTLPQYSEKNPWKRYSFSPDWKRHAWVKDGDLFVGSFTGSTITSAYDETPGVKIGGKPTFNGGKRAYRQPRFSADGKRIFALANDEKVYSADPSSPDQLTEEATLDQGSFFGGRSELLWDLTADGKVVKRPAPVHPERGGQATSPDGTKTLIYNGSGWFLKANGATGEPQLAFETLTDDTDKPVGSGPNPGMDVDIIGWY
ncbi:PQQ-like beta-propeller repeat protein [Streptomyces lavendulae]|uniref:WD40-like Beta Propeller Repeat protein n=1 Tax=Streptomyces lavendulae subsp. lavendulae TaxID=58340 RepID=A0A2K8P944_STRLA|nr:PQQ-like beta-propeller repeat protein [Streptomyces lavendulae]ATZ22135.1 hypothetical protein SLAV_01030 [Streptomyces lavendulae subsp. lavendulae]ATZ29436.1 hypothetical protein SLAV_38360 [Streptomyces lavendulae subsp. lavendulae]